MNNLLLIISSHIFDKQYLSNIKNIIEKIITPLTNDNINVNICLISSHNDFDNYEEILKDYNKIKIICKERQYVKLINLFTYLKDNNISYDYYIKIRPEIYIKEIIDLNKLESYNKNGINTRVRFYLGPEINIPYGCTSPQCKYWKESCIYNKELKTIVPDDQIFIFNHNTGINAFSNITNEELNNQNSIDYYYYHPNINWIKKEVTISDIINNELKNQTEWFHGLMYNIRNVNVIPTSFDVEFTGRSNISNDLIVKQN